MGEHQPGHDDQAASTDQPVQGSPSESEQMLIPVTSSNQPESSSQGPAGHQSDDTTSLKRSRSDSQDDATTDAKKSRQENQEEAAAEASSCE